MSVLSSSPVSQQAVAFRRIAELSNQKAQFFDQIAKIDGEIGNLQGGGVVTVAPQQKRRGRPPKAASEKKVSNGNGRKRSSRAKNEKSLPTLVEEILQGSKVGLTIGEITTKVREAGYKSNTKGDFGQIVYQTLYKMLTQHKTVVKEEDSGKYKIAA